MPFEEVALSPDVDINATFIQTHAIQMIQVSLHAHHLYHTEGIILFCHHTLGLASTVDKASSSKNQKPENLMVEQGGGSCCQKVRKCIQEMVTAENPRIIGGEAELQGIKLGRQIKARNGGSQETTE